MWFKLFFLLCMIGNSTFGSTRLLTLSDHCCCMLREQFEQAKLSFHDITTPLVFHHHLDNKKHNLATLKKDISSRIEQFKKQGSPLHDLMNGFEKSPFYLIKSTDFFIKTFKLKLIVSKMTVAELHDKNKYAFFLRNLFLLLEQEKIIVLINPTVDRPIKDENDLISNYFYFAHNYFSLMPEYNKLREIVEENKQKIALLEAKINRDQGPSIAIKPAPKISPVENKRHSMIQQCILILGSIWFGFFLGWLYYGRPCHA